MQGDCFDTVIISDLHLGSEVSRAGDALEFLQSVRFKRLVLLGGIFSDLNFRRLAKEHWKFLGYIRKLSNPRATRYIARPLCVLFRAARHVLRPLALDNTAPKTRRSGTLRDDLSMVRWLIDSHIAFPGKI